MSRVTLPPGGDAGKVVRGLALARELMDEHGLEKWTLKRSRLKATAGSCNRLTREIELSVPMMSIRSEDDTRDTILHEIAHALSRGNHGAHWRMVCRQIGARPEPCFSDPDVREKLAKWKGTCPAGHVTYRHRKLNRDFACTTCAPYFSRENLFRWELNQPAAS